MSDPNVRSIIGRPIRELSQVAWMQGTWRATGSYELSDGSSKRIEPTTWVFAPVLNNRWLFGADGRSQDYLYLTFDPFLRRWTALRFAANPAYGIWISDRGWVDNRIDFVTNFSYANGRQYRRRLTIIRKDARTFGIYETEQLPDGTWTPDDAVELTRKG